MKILVADDDVVTSRVLESRLKQWGYEVVLATNGAEAWEHLQKEDCAQMTLLDWMMPEMDGVDVVRRVRTLDPEPYRYIIMLTAKGDQEDIVAGMQAGADDYLSKPVDSRELQVRIRAGQRIVDLQNQLVKAREALRYQATHDSLTGLWNHVSILDFLERELSRGARLEDPVAVVMADIDRFKEINDTYGHQAGDAVLEQLSAQLKACVRCYDAVGRYGGEEFLIVLSDCNEKSAHEFAHRVRQNIASANFFIEDKTINVTISLGVVVWPAQGEVQPGDLVRAADESLYSAKLAGRNRVEITTWIREGSALRPRKGATVSPTPVLK